MISWKQLLHLLFQEREFTWIEIWDGRCPSWYRSPARWAFGVNLQRLRFEAAFSRQHVHRVLLQFQFASDVVIFFIVLLEFPDGVSTPDLFAPF